MPYFLPSRKHVYNFDPFKSHFYIVRAFFFLFFFFFFIIIFFTYNLYEKERVKEYIDVLMFRNYEKISDGIFQNYKPEDNFSNFRGKYNL